MTAAGDDVDLGRGVVLHRSEVIWRFSTSGGPGGQHVNTSNTRAEAVWTPAAATGLPEWARRRIQHDLGPVVTVAASDTRSQTRNRELALDRLAEKVRAALAPPPPPRRATRPTAASQRRRLDQKRQRARLKKQRRNGPDE
ncbi:MAG: alternative ribosome rescue aminoacyl-tRNA hydrolase ArfB [Actinomycetota bacterium]|nr:alternative ribosome rescue aminoacyl-tRNA hydrolase ArfB [Actinomycetota bacterium]